MKKLAFTVGAFFAASLLPPIAFALLWPIDGDISVESAAATFIVLFPISAMAVMLLGGSAFFLLRRFAPGRWWWVMLVGFVLGMCVAVVIRLPNIPGPGEFVQMGSLGAASALVFWLIWRRGQAPRPDTELLKGNGA